MTRTGGRWIHICHTVFNVFSWGRQRSFFTIFFKLIMLFFKVEKEKDGATIKSKKNAEGRKVRMNISALVALYLPLWWCHLRIYIQRKTFKTWERDRKTERQRDRNAKAKKNSISWCQGTLHSSNDSCLHRWFSGLDVWGGHPSACKQALGKASGFYRF